MLQLYRVPDYPSGFSDKPGGIIYDGKCHPTVYHPRCCYNPCDHSLKTEVKIYHPEDQPMMGSMQLPNHAPQSNLAVYHARFYPDG
jgi:hypothetical protein